MFEPSTSGCHTRERSHPHLALYATIVPRAPGDTQRDDIGHGYYVTVFGVPMVTIERDQRMRCVRMQVFLVRNLRSRLSKTRHERIPSCHLRSCG